MALVEIPAGGVPAALWPVRGEPGGAPTVHIVDPGEDGRLLSAWLRAVGLGSRRYGDLDDFADAAPRDAPGCLVIDADVACPGGADLPRLARRLGGRWPIVMTAQGADVATAVLAMKTGAIDFVEKPFRQRDILGAIDAAIGLDQQGRQAAARTDAVTRCFAVLTPRERQVMALVTAGLLNKQVAGRLGLSEITVKAHRGAAMRKMAARSLADLVRMADVLAAAGGEPALVFRTAR